MARTIDNEPLDRSKLWTSPISFAPNWVRSIGYSFIGAGLLFVATETQLLDKVELAKWATLIIGLCLIVYVLFPWVLLGLVCLTLSKMARVEGLIRKHLLWRYPKSHHLRTLFDPSYHRETLFAVTAFVWSENHPDHLLWIMNRTHKRWLPPGGRLLANELPHEAIRERVCSETGIPVNSLSFCKLFHTVNSEHIAVDENIVPAPIPLRVQKELVEQRDGIPYHYD